jgi:DNA topoisomerase IA
MSKKIKTTTTLVIVESPAKCKKIEEYLGPGYKCIATYGHLRALVSLKDIDINNNFNPTLEPVICSMDTCTCVPEINLSKKIIPLLKI